MPLLSRCLARVLGTDSPRGIELEPGEIWFSGREDLLDRLEVEGCLQKSIGSHLVEFGDLDELFGPLMTRQMMLTSRWRDLLGWILETAT